MDTLLVDPPFTRQEWAAVRFDDMREGGTALGRRVLGYVRQYHTAVMRSNRLSAAEVPSGPGERVLRRLVERHDATMMAVGEFARFLGERQGVSLVLCVNRHFGLAR